MVDLTRKNARKPKISQDQTPPVKTIIPSVPKSAKVAKSVKNSHALISSPSLSMVGHPPTKPKPTLDPDKFPWEFQEFDTLKSFSFFQVYLALGSGRSLAKTEITLKKHSKMNQRNCATQDPNKCDDYIDTKLSSILSHTPAANGALAVYSHDNLWALRARAWDAHLSQLQMDAQINEITYMNKQQAKRFAKLQDLANDRFDDIKSLPKITRWRDVPVLIEMLREGAKGERVARGLSVDNNKSEVTINQDFNMSGLSSSEIDQFMLLQSKVLPGASNSPTIIIDVPESNNFSTNLDNYASIDVEDLIEIDD